MKQTALTDFSFSSASSINEEDVFVKVPSYRSTPAARRSTRQPLSDLTNTASVASPLGKGKSREGEGTPWQLKKKKSGLPSLRDEGPPFSNSFDEQSGGSVRPTRATASAAAAASALRRGGAGRLRAKLSLTSRSPSAAAAIGPHTADPIRFDEVNLLSSQDG